jgi:1,2-diacylglycerol-3-alpha-glucose alpha-1,2-galactosyltransferase
MKIRVIYETSYKGNGVYTSFVDYVSLMQQKGNEDIQLLINDEKGDADLLHSHTYSPYYFLKGWRHKKRRVLTVHVIPDSIKGSLPMSKWMLPIVRWYFKQVYSYADVCIAIAPHVKDAIEALGSKTKIVTIYNPIFVEKWQRTDEKRKRGRALLKLDENAFLVLGVGQLQARKGVEDFIDIAAQIPEAQFCWVGGRPLKMTEGKNRIDSHIEQAPDNIHFTGMFSLEEMPLVYAAADLMLFPSYQENCPLAPLEAASSGIPVIFRNLSEYALLYENPYLKADSTEEFVNMTKEIIHSPELYQQGVLISQQLIKQFEKEMVRQKLLALYHDLLNQPQ